MRQLLPHLLAGLVTQRMPHEEKAHGRQRCIVSGQRIEPRGPVIDAKAQLQRAVCTVPQGASGEGHIGPKPDVAGQVGVDKPINVAVSPQSGALRGPRIKPCRSEMNSARPRFCRRQNACTPRSGDVMDGWRPLFLDFSVSGGRQIGVDKPVNVAVSPQSSRFAGAPDQTMPVGSEFRPAKVLPQAKRLYAAQRRCHGRLASLIS